MVSSHPSGRTPTHAPLNVKCQPENLLLRPRLWSTWLQRRTIVPIGMESLVNNKPNQRKTFASHCRNVYVLGTSFEHYRAWKIWMINTRATRVSANVFHKHKYLSNPTATPADDIIAAARNLITEIKGHLHHRLQESHNSGLGITILLESSAEQPPHFHYTYGANPSLRPNANSCSSKCPLSNRTSPPTPTSMVNMTTTPNHSYLSAWSL